MHAGFGRGALEKGREVPRQRPTSATCGARSLGTQFCEDCRTFMSRVGIGAPCPNCDEPVAAIELVPEAVEHHA